MRAVLIALLAGTGAFLVLTSSSSSRRRDRPTLTLAEWMTQAGLGHVGRVEFFGVVTTLALVGGLAGYAVFGAMLPAVAIAVFSAGVPVASYRRRREQRRQIAQEHWPTLIDELQVLTATSGRSIPHALFEVGRRAPQELRDPFAAAQREWLMTTDFARTLDVLRSRLADPTADLVCETLLVAHEVGGGDLPRRLEALAEDRRIDARHRLDAQARQAGARFARWFVLLVPAGMALAGLSVGNGRDAYRTPAGQILVSIGVALTVSCWVWAGRIMRLPDEPRVLRG